VRPPQAAYSSRSQVLAATAITAARLTWDRPSVGVVRIGVERAAGNLANTETQIEIENLTRKNSAVLRRRGTGSFAPARPTGDLT
jgi:hypothetical protein